MDGDEVKWKKGVDEKRAGYSTRDNGKVVTARMLFGIARLGFRVY